MAQPYNDLAVLDGLTKRVYGKGVHQAIPDNIKFVFDTFPFVPNGERLGNLFAEPVNLSIEQGVTRTAVGATGVFTLNAPVASTVKQAVVDAAAIIMQAVVSWDAVARARSPNSAQSFESALTTIVDNVLLSHRRHQVSDILFGGTDIGVVASGSTGTTVTLTAASTCAGLWYGSTGMKVDIYSADLATKRNTANSGAALSVVSFQVDPGSSAKTITFDASVAASTNDRIVFAGTVAAGAIITPPGLSAIASTTTSSLFGINQALYPVFAASNYNVGGGPLTLQAIDKAAILPMNRGYSGASVLMTAPENFSNLAMEETSRVQLVGGAASGTARIGFDELRITTSSGANVTCQASPWLKAGESFLVPKDGSLRRVGAVDIQLGGPADPQPTWRRLEGQTGYSLPTYSLSALFTPEPWKIVRMYNSVAT